MIKVTKLNGAPIHINAELIETVAATPDTVITLTNGSKLLVSEPADEVVARIMRYRKQVARRVVVARRSAEER